MQKFLLVSMCAAFAGVSYAAKPAAVTPAGDAISVNPNFGGNAADGKMMKVMETPVTEWGEWTELESSTVSFPDPEFLFQGVNSEVPTFYREAVNEEGHAQYRFDNVFVGNVSAEATPLYVDVYSGDSGEQITAYSQPLPQLDLGEEMSQICPGPYAVCDMAVAYDVEYYRVMNEYTANPLAMRLSLVVYDTSMSGMEGMLSMGTIDIKTNAKPAFSIPSKCVIGGDMGMGLLKVEKKDEVWSIRYALEKGGADKLNMSTYDTENIIDRIKNGDESLMIMQWMAGDIMAAPGEGFGHYTLGAVAYDENDAVLGTAVCDVYNMPSETWAWKDLGMAKVSEDFLREVFAMNLENAGIAADGPVSYEVAVSESNTTPGLYRLENLYGPAHPYSAMFEYLNEFPVYTYIDCTDPEACYIHIMPTGFIVAGDKSGEMGIGGEPAIYLEQGWPMEMVKEEMPENFGKLADNCITFTSEQVGLSIPVFLEYFGSEWVSGDLCTSNDFTILLPESDAVESLESAAGNTEYFDVSGRRVADPLKGGGVLIKRSGSKVEKIIR